MSLQLLGDIQYYEGNRWIGRGTPYFGLFQETLRNMNAPEADTNVVFVSHLYLSQNGLAPPNHPPADKVAGVGNFGSVCSPDYASRTIVERGAGRTGGGQVAVYLHEVAHNLGMGHRKFWARRLGSDICERSKPQISLMRSYLFESWPQGRQYVWSQCNRCDMLRNYQKQMIERGSYCLDRS